MNISLNWLKDYIQTDLNVEEICEILTSIGPVSYTHLTLPTIGG